MKQLSTVIISNNELLPETHLLCIKSPDIANIAKPGQFVMINCGQDLILRRPLSIHQIVNSNQLYLLFRIAGKGTLWLSQRQEGEMLDLLGPLGNGFSIQPASEKVLLIAGGIGIAPLAFLAQKALAQGKLVTLLLGAPTATQLCPRQFLPDGIHTIVTTDDGSTGNKGMVTDLLPDFIDWADQVYACGPLSMYQTIAQQQQVKKPIQISLEVRMGCGLGTCYGCSIKTKQGMKRICQDGPVFDLEDILWQEVKI